MSAAHDVALQRPPYAPTVAELSAQLPTIGHSLAQAMDALRRSPSLAVANQVAAQLAGAQAYVQRLREALNRETAESASDGRP